MPPGSHGSCSAVILCMHNRTRHLTCEGYWSELLLISNRKKIQFLVWCFTPSSPALLPVASLKLPLVSVRGWLGSPPREPWAMARNLLDGEERWAATCRTMGAAPRSWNWKIRLCQCVVWINEDEMYCMNAAWLRGYPLGSSCSQGEKVELCLWVVLLAPPAFLFGLLWRTGSMCSSALKHSRSADSSRLSFFT